MSRTLKTLWWAIVPMSALLVACSPEKHVRIVIVPEQDALNAARQQRVNLTDLVFKKNAAGRIEEHPYFFRRDALEPHGDGCESVVTISVSRREEVVWEADSRFQILSIAKSGNKPCQPPWQDLELAPGNPFYGTMPYPSTAGAPFVVHSGVARPESIGQHYKIRIDIQGQTIDPDIFCMS